MDLPRFVNEFPADVSTPAAVVHLRAVIRQLAQGTGVSEAAVARVTFMKTVLANLWNVEGNRPVEAAALDVAEGLRALGIDGSVE